MIDERENGRERSIVTLTMSPSTAMLVYCCVLFSLGRVDGGGDEGNGGKERKIHFVCVNTERAKQET